MAVARCFFVFLALAAASPSDIPSPGQAGHPSPDCELSDISEEALLEEDIVQNESEELVLVGDGGGFDHIKVSQAAPSNALAVALRESLEIQAAEDAAEQVCCDALQRQLDLLEPGSELDRSTPKDNSCLFHALKRGGLTALLQATGDLSVAQLRRMALNVATPHQLELAASCVGDKGIPVQTYVDRMKRYEWGQHRYFECDHPEHHAVAKRQANRNRVEWKGYGAKLSAKKSGSKVGMKDSHDKAREWIRQPWDPEYTPAGDVTPKRAYLNKCSHISDRTKLSLRALWQMDEADAMECLIDGGFCTDVCLDKQGQIVQCTGVLKVCYANKKGQENRQLRCAFGGSHKLRHKLHWLAGSVFQGHSKLCARDVVGVLQAFGACKSIELAAMDTGLHRSTNPN